MSEKEMHGYGNGNKVDNVRVTAIEAWLRWEENTRDRW